MTNNEDLEVKFDEFVLGTFKNGLQVPRTREEWLEFLRNLIKEARKAERKRIVGVVEGINIQKLYNERGGIQNVEKALTDLTEKINNLKEDYK